MAVSAICANGCSHFRHPPEPGRISRDRVAREGDDTCNRNGRYGDAGGRAHCFEGMGDFHARSRRAAPDGANILTRHGTRVSGFNTLKSYPLVRCRAETRSGLCVCFGARRLGTGRNQCPSKARRSCV